VVAVAVVALRAPATRRVHRQPVEVEAQVA
jgi:hypothetical protein